MTKEELFKRNFPDYCRGDEKDIKGEYYFAEEKEDEK